MSQAVQPDPLLTKQPATPDPHSIPLDEIDVAQLDLFEHDSHWGYFERLRNEAPVHYCAKSDFGAYWSVTRFNDIVEVEKKDEIFSSAHTISILDVDPDFPVEAGFISMDGPQHIAERKAAQPVLAPRNLRRLEPLIRERTVEILDGLPLNETFNFVDRVSVELTTAMLATLFDFPQEERNKLTFWSDMITSNPATGMGLPGITEKERMAALLECLKWFSDLKEARKDNAGGESHDFVTALARADATKDQSPADYLGNLILLIVGGNDTTRNSMTGGVLALNENPAEYQKLRDNPELIPIMVSEIIRWQTPLAHMRRTATQDTVLGGQTIKKGEKVIMWYVSGNRDETVIERANEFLIDRKNAKQHLSFGWGVHFCVGSRLAEMQLRVLWEEIHKRYETIEVVEPPVRVRSNFVKGFTDLNVRLHPRT